jgi:hypothetical protein
LTLFLDSGLDCRGHATGERPALTKLFRSGGETGGIQAKGDAVASRIVRCFVLLAALALGACADHSDQLQVSGPAVGRASPELFGGVKPGTVSGGTGSLESGVTDSEFKAALEYALGHSAALAHDETSARYALDAAMDFGQTSDETVVATITYRLHRAGGGQPVFERSVKTAAAIAPAEAGTAAINFLAGGIGGLIGGGIRDSHERHNAAYQKAVRQNLSQLLAALSQWTPPAVPVAKSAAASGVVAATSPPPSAALVAASQPPRSSNPDFHCPKPGTVIKFSDGSAATFDSGLGFSCIYAARTGARLIPATIFGPYSDNAAGELRKLWPMSVGRQVKFTGREREETFSVVRQEPVTVPAGSFDAFVIEWEASDIGGNHGNREKVAYWFAPELGYFVRVQHLAGPTTTANPDREALQVMQ